MPTLPEMPNQGAVLPRRVTDTPTGSPPHHGAFGQDRFGHWAENAARFFGTPQYIVGQTIVVILWVILNALASIGRWDPYPFILLNLGFSLQAAYAAPLILLAQTRQADRDKIASDLTEEHREAIASSAAQHQATVERTTKELKELLRSNTELTLQDKQLTEQVATLTREIHARLT